MLAGPGRIASRPVDGASAERDLDAPYERIEELVHGSPSKVEPRGLSCTEGRHHKRTPAVVAYELSAVSGQRVLVAPYVAAACARHRDVLERFVRVRADRFSRGGAIATAERIE